jgi:hypothetical protein
MKNLIPLFALLTLAACGPAFSASEFSPSDNAGGAIGLGQAGDPVGAAGSPSSTAGASSAMAGAGGSTEDLGGSGSGSAAGAAESGGGAGGMMSAAGAPSMGGSAGHAAGGEGGGGTHAGGASAGGAPSAGSAGAGGSDPVPPCDSPAWTMSESIYPQGSVYTAICQANDGAAAPCDKGKRYAWTCTSNSCSVYPPGSGVWWVEWSPTTLCD